MANNNRKRKNGRVGDNQVDGRYNDTTANDRSNTSRNRSRQGGRPAKDRTVGNTNCGFKPDNDTSYSRATNDIAWHAANPELLRDSASLNFSYPVGIRYKINRNLPDWSVPGIAVYDVVPSVGYSEDLASPVNVAATAAYTWIRHMNSGARNYDATDLMIMLCAMADAYAAVIYLQRCYGVFMYYNQYNRYTPESLLRAMGMDPTELQANAANYRENLNVIINKLASIAVPSTLPYFNRRAFLYKYIYSDGISTKAQMYALRPKGFHKFTLNPTTGAGQLTFSIAPYVATGLATPTQWFAYVNDLISNLYTFEDIGIMSGDILKAYGADKLIKLTNVTPDFKVTPVFDHIVLESLKNALIVPFSNITANSLDVTQVIINTGNSTSGWINAKPTFVMDVVDTANFYTGDHMVWTSNPEPDPGYVMEITRFMPTFEKSEDGETQNVYNIMPAADFIVGVHFWNVSNSTTDQSCEVAEIRTNHVNISDTAPYPRIDSIPQYLTMLSNALAFKYHPMISTGYYDHNGDPTATPTISEYAFMGDIDNFSLVASTVLKNINEVDILSLLNVPAIGKVASLQ